MQYKHEFSETRPLRADQLHFHCQESSCVLGMAIGKQVGHTFTPETGIHKIEVIAYPIEKWKEFLQGLHTLLPLDLRKPVKDLIDKMDPTPQDFYGDLLKTP